MKLYVIYARFSRDVFDKRVKRIIPNKFDYDYDEEKNMYVGLYAWSKKKKYITEFLETRHLCKNYTVKDIEVDEDEYQELKVKHKEMMLNRFQYDDGNGYQIEVLTTLNEYIETCENTSENLYDIIGAIAESEYQWFCEDLIDALDTIFYTTEYDMVIGGDSSYVDEDEQVMRTANADNNVSYGLTVGGREYRSYMDNKFACLTYIFKPMFIETTRLEGLY